jgi:TBC domain-containing protein kinase-like protein
VNPLLQRMGAASLDQQPPLLMSTTTTSTSTSTSTSTITTPALASGPVPPATADRERDLDYQATRLRLMRRLLAGLPYTREHVRRQAEIDIPPLLRGAIWRVLLDCDTHEASAYTDIDREADSSMDHQLALDIPRCHQYDWLLSSPAGHTRLRCVLKAWIASHPGLTYWQGLDSLCAPFVRLNVTAPHHAYVCFTAFIDRYLTNFFLRDNSEVIGEYLAVYSQLIAYTDPALATHLANIGFIPELYAISWFLTCFAHVFPLDKLVRLWDVLLRHDSRMPLCIGAAILLTQRTTLLASDFNSCILRFSDVPDVDVDEVVTRAVSLCQETPASLLARARSTPPSEVQPETADVATRKLQTSPTLSLADFDSLLRERADLLLIDTRGAAEPGNADRARVLLLPVDEALDGAELRAEAVALLRRATRTRTHVIVAAHRPSAAPRMSQALVAAGIARVAVLQGGIDGLRVRNFVL